MQLNKGGDNDEISSKKKKRRKLAKIEKYLNIGIVRVKSPQSEHAYKD